MARLTARTGHCGHQRASALTLLTSWLLVATGAVAGCGGDDAAPGPRPGPKVGQATSQPNSPPTGSSSARAPHAAGEPLTATQARRSLLTAENLGPGYEQAVFPEGGGGEPPFGCLSAIGDFGEDSGADIGISIRFAFQPATSAGLPEVTSGVSSFDTAAEARSFLADFTDSLADCRNVDKTAKNGANVKLHVAVDNDPLEGLDVDEQTNVAAGGTLTFGDAPLDFSVAMSVTRTGTNIVAVLSTDLNDVDQVEQFTSEYVTLAVRRMFAVAAGDEPPPEIAISSPQPHGSSQATA